MSLAPPDVDYTDTSQRPTWAQLPTAVHEAVARIAGGPVAGAERPVRSGFTGSYAGIVAESSGRRLFVKASGPELAHSVEALAREADVLSALPRGIPAPSLVGFRSVDGWSVLVLDVVDGRMPGLPWTAADVDAAHEACLVIAELGTPTELGGRDYAARIAEDPLILAVARGLGDGSLGSAPELPAWLGRYAQEVAPLVLGASGRFEGDTISHGDLRPDNILVTPAGRAVVVDWNWVGRAAPWLDFVGLLPAMARQGVDVDGLLTTSPLTKGVDPQAIDAFLACIAAYMIDGYPRQPPTGCLPVVRRHQLRMAHDFLELLRRRRGWDD